MNIYIKIMLLTASLLFLALLPSKSLSKEPIVNERFEWESADVQTLWDLLNRGSLKIKRPLTLEDRKKISKLPVQTIYVSEHAGLDLFEKPQITRELKEVDFIESFNAAHLKNLESNYKKIDRIYIKQSSCINLNGNFNFKNLKRLKYLELRCELTSVSPLTDIFPNSLKTLSLNGTDMFENKLLSRKYYLPELKVLKVRSEKIDKSFANFDIPKVREIYLNNSTIEPGCLQDLSKLQNLRWLNLDNSVISSTDIDSILESNTLERIWIRGIKIIGIGTEEAIDKLEKKFEVVS